MKAVIKRLVPERILRRYRAYQMQRSLPNAAMRQDREDCQGLPRVDPGPERAIEATLRWLCRAQDCSSSADGGVARHFSLLSGWSPSYPETTGYIVPTMLVEADLSDQAALRQRARRMLDWFVAIQFPEGAFQGGTIASDPPVPVTFNTGQVLLGLAAGATAFDDEAYSTAMHRAARWLVETQDADGCWRRFPTPFAEPGEKTYETHVSWGLFEAERAAPGHGYGEAGQRQVRWALGNQQPNGWFTHCCLNDSDRPLTHTIGYSLRGLLEAYRLENEPHILDAALRTGEALASCLGDDGFLPGRLDSQWRPTVQWACLTGSVQVTYCWFLLSELSGDTRFYDAGLRANAYVRRTIALDGDPDVVGGVRGSFPNSGDYGAYQYLNWAAKFFIDSNRKELELLNKI
jgi:hypothetical protein